MAVRKSAVSIATRLHPLLNTCVLFALVKLAFVALLSGNVLGFGSRVVFTSGAVNTIMRKGCGHLLASMTAKHWKLMCLFADIIISEYSTLYWLILWGFFCDTFEVQWHAHISHVVSANSCYRAQKNGWPLVTNVASVQSKEMNGQTSDVAVISCWPRPARTPPPPPPPPPILKKKGPPNGTVKDLKKTSNKNKSVVLGLTISMLFQQFGRPRFSIFFRGSTPPDPH